MTERNVTVYLRMIAQQYKTEAKQAKAETKDLREEVQRLDKAASGLTKAGLISGAVSTLPGLLGPVAAGVASLSGLVLSGAAAFGTLAIATNGVGTAMKAVADGDAKKLAESMATLSADARQFVHEYERIKPALDVMGDSNQDEFFRQFHGDMEMLTGVYLPTMLNQLPQLASALGKAAHETAVWAAAPSQVAAFNRQIVLATDLTDDFGRLLRNGTGLMLDLSDASGDFTKGLVSGLADGVEGMRRWSSAARATGQTTRILENAENVLGRIASLSAEAGDLLLDMAANPALADATMTLLDLLHTMLDIVHALFDAFEALPAPMQSSVAMFVAIAAAAMLLAGRVAAMRSALLSASISLREMGDTGNLAARGLEVGARWASRAAAAFVALQVISAIGSAMRGAAADVDTLSKSLQHLVATGQLDSVAIRQFGGDLELLRHDLRRTAKGGLEDVRGGAGIEGIFGDIPSLFTDESEKLTLERMEALDSALANMHRSGNAAGAARAFGVLRQEAQKLGIDQAKLLTILPQYATAVEQAGQATDAMAIAQAKASMNAAILNEGLAGAVREAGSLEEAFDRLHGAALNFAEAELQAEEAVDRLTESFHKNGKSMDVTTDAGQANKKAMVDLIKASIGAAQAKYDETGSLEQASQVYTKYIGQLRSAMLAAGLNKTEVERLLSAYANMPPLIATEVTAPGLSKVLTDIETLEHAIENLSGARIQANIASGSARGYRWGGITPTHARDGLLSKAGIFNAGARPLYAFAEPETVQEGFVPRNGDPGRSLPIINTMAGWYGASLMPGGMSMGGGPSTVVVQLIDPQTGAVMRQKQIDFAKSRGVPAASIRSAHP